MPAEKRFLVKNRHITNEDSQDFPGTLAARFAAAHAAISIDTGPGHLAAAVGCPLVSVFGPSDPKLFLPRGPGRVELVLGSAPCQFCLGTPRFDACRDNLCLNRLETGTLMAAWRRLVPPTAAAQRA